MIDLKSLTQEELTQALKEMGEPAFHMALSRCYFL